MKAELLKALKLLRMDLQTQPVIETQEILRKLLKEVVTHG